MVPTTSLSFLRLAVGEHMLTAIGAQEPARDFKKVKRSRQIISEIITRITFLNHNPWAP